MLRISLLLSFSLFATVGCQPKNDAFDIIGKAISAHGGDAYEDNSQEIGVVGI